MRKKASKSTGELGELAAAMPTHPQLLKAAQAVRNLAKEQGTITARDAHDAWRWALVSCGSHPWKYGEQFDEAARTHPQLVAFDKLPADQQEHALGFLEDDDAEQDGGVAGGEPGTRSVSR